jgi:hypothetical protein
MAYDPNQPRDQHGMWSAGGGASEYRKMARMNDKLSAGLTVRAKIEARAKAAGDKLKATMKAQAIPRYFVDAKQQAADKGAIKPAPGMKLLNAQPGWMARTDTTLGQKLRDVKARAGDRAKLDKISVAANKGGSGGPHGPGGDWKTAYFKNKYGK